MVVWMISGFTKKIASKNSAEISIMAVKIFWSFLGLLHYRIGVAFGNYLEKSWKSFQVLLVMVWWLH